MQNQRSIIPGRELTEEELKEYEEAFQNLDEIFNAPEEPEVDRKHKLYKDLKYLKNAKEQELI